MPRTKQSERHIFDCGLSIPKNPTVAVGEVYGRLTIAGMPFYSIRFPSKGTEQCVVCNCSCGNTVILSCNGVKSGNASTCSLSCGHKTHGQTGTSTFNSWTAMKKRCYGNDDSHQRYRDKGIQVCDRWLESFENFLADMGPRPSKRHTIERKENSGNYEPGNCVWALPVEQQRNRDDCIYVTLHGKRLTVSEAASVVGINRHTVYSRIRMGWSIEEALHTPTRNWTKR